MHVNVVRVVPDNRNCTALDSDLWVLRSTNLRRRSGFAVPPEFSVPAPIGQLIGNSYGKPSLAEGFPVIGSKPRKSFRRRNLPARTDNVV